MDTLQASPERRNRRKLSSVFLAIGFILLGAAHFIGTNDNLPGIAALFFGGLFAIWGIIYLLWKPGNSTIGQELLYWAPRVLCISYALFTSAFAADVFEGEGGNPLETAVALLMHLVPAFLVLLLLVISWRWEWIGGTLLILVAVLYVLSMRARPFIPLSVSLTMASPLVLTGALFLLNWRYKRVFKEISIGGMMPRWVIPLLVAIGLVVIPFLTFTLESKGEPVTFNIDAPTAQHVFLAGSFNNWNPSAIPMIKQPQGRWTVTVPLPPGHHEYKFIVDTMWVHDVNNPNKVELKPPLQGYNSVVDVGK
jgi:hypothetical protein